MKRNLSILLSCAMAVMSVAGGACGSDEGGNNAAGSGLCLAAGVTCPTDCTGDADCSASGKVCCTQKVLGQTVRFCEFASACLRPCTGDEACDTSSGEACCSNGNSLMDGNYCRPVQDCVRPCGGDGECSDGDVCCLTLKAPFCTSPYSCPSRCDTALDCGDFETCCPTRSDRFDGSVCLERSSCPRACTNSAGCDTLSGEQCCDGWCSATCANACEASVDCNTSAGQTCCKSDLLGVLPRWIEELVWGGNP